MSFVLPSFLLFIVKRCYSLYCLIFMLKISLNICLLLSLKMKFLFAFVALLRSWGWFMRVSRATWKRRDRLTCSLGSVNCIASSPPPWNFFPGASASCPLCSGRVWRKGGRCGVGPRRWQEEETLQLPRKQAQEWTRKIRHSSRKEEQRTFEELKVKAMGKRSSLQVELRNLAKTSCSLCLRQL